MQNNPLCQELHFCLERKLAKITITYYVNVHIFIESLRTYFDNPAKFLQLILSFKSYSGRGRKSSTSFAFELKFHTKLLWIFTTKVENYNLLERKCILFRRSNHVVHNVSKHVPQLVWEKILYLTEDCSNWAYPPTCFKTSFKSFSSNLIATWLALSPASFASEITCSHSSSVRKWGISKDKEQF